MEIVDFSEKALYEFCMSIVSLFIDRLLIYFYKLVHYE